MHDISENPHETNPHVTGLYPADSRAYLKSPYSHMRNNVCLLCRAIAALLKHNVPGLLKHTSLALLLKHTIPSC